MKLSTSSETGDQKRRPWAQERALPTLILTPLLFHEAGIININPHSCSLPWPWAGIININPHSSSLSALPALSTLTLNPSLMSGRLSGASFSLLNGPERLSEAF